MGLKGYRLWVMGQLDSDVQSPTAHPNAISATVPPSRQGRLIQSPTVMLDLRLNRDIYVIAAVVAGDKTA
jgi:hypothetical protein